MLLQFMEGALYKSLLTDLATLVCGIVLIF